MSKALFWSPENQIADASAYYRCDTYCFETKQAGHPGPPRYAPLESRNLATSSVYGKTLKKISIRLASLFFPAYHTIPCLGYATRSFVHTAATSVAANRGSVGGLAVATVCSNCRTIILLTESYNRKRQVDETVRAANIITRLSRILLPHQSQGNTKRSPSQQTLYLRSSG